MKRAALLATVLFATSCAAAGTSARPPVVNVSADTLGPGDEFTVTVFGEPELSQTYRVLPDGTISFPYLHGPLAVAGHSAGWVQTELHDRLVEGRVLRDPTVIVHVTAVNSRTVVVLGQVQHPGTFPWQQNMTVVQGITSAGGFTALADQGNVVLTRPDRQGPRTYTVHVDAISQGREATFNLAPGDTLFVRERVF